MEKSVEDATTDKRAAFFSLIRNPAKFRLYLLSNLPAAFFSGLRVEQVSAEICTVSVPFRWFTKNPFRSTYFACLSMAAELSTGVLAMACVYRQSPRVSMLVKGVEAKFYKRATAKTYFTCNHGPALANAVELAINSKDGQETTVVSVGKNKEGEVIAEFWITWSFKAK